MIRAFVGLAVPGGIATMLEAAQAGLPVGNPVERENLHMTLAFLGEHQEPVIEEVHAELDQIRAEPVTLDITGLGTFGDASPRVLFADVDSSPPLTALRKKVRQSARAAGIDLGHERFHPHITLARFGRGLIGEDVLALQGFVARRLGRVGGRFTAEAFVLYESRLLSQGPAYSVLAEYPLQG